MTPPLLLLLPGLDGTGEMFEPFLPHVPPNVSKDWEVRVVRYPRDRHLPLRELAKLAAEGIPADRPVAVVAESFSGPVALELARLGTLDIRAFIFVATFVRPPFPYLVGLSRWLPLAALISFPRPRWYVRATSLAGDSSEELVTRLIEVNRTVHPEVLAARIRSLAGIDYSADLARLAVPCLYLQATADRTVPGWNIGPFRRHLPDLKVETIDGPHLLLQARPAECARAIFPFLAGINLGGQKGS